MASGLAVVLPAVCEYSFLDLLKSHTPYNTHYAHNCQVCSTNTRYIRPKINHRDTGASGKLASIGVDCPMLPDDSACFRPTQPAYPIQIVQDAHVNHPPAPSPRTYRFEHGSVFRFRSAGVSLPRTQVHAVERVVSVRGKFHSVEHGAGRVVVESYSSAKQTILSFLPLASPSDWSRGRNLERAERIAPN